MFLYIAWICFAGSASPLHHRGLHINLFTMYVLDWWCCRCHHHHHRETWKKYVVIMQVYSNKKFAADSWRSSLIFTCLYKIVSAIFSLGSGTEDDIELAQAIELLSVHAEELEVSSVLALLPPTWSLPIIHHYLRAALRNSMHQVGPKSYIMHSQILLLSVLPPLPI